MLSTMGNLLRYNIQLLKQCESLLYSSNSRNSRNYATYIQGQCPEPRVREYFYYIDHQGMLFLDDSRMKNFTSCFKDKKFLAFFFKRLRTNNLERYKEFPYISLCGRERNFVRCDDLPIVFTHIIERHNVKSGDIEHLFSYAHADDLLTVPFEPNKIYMNINSGRVYHPAPEVAGGAGLVTSKLAIEFSSFFTFEKGERHGPTHFTWKGRRYDLDQKWYK
ncbi:UPF0598 protein CG30010 [Orussus abietinus]|uniref:UPF0598 protein CG30010 n=1 Tax=Orussus abietinus TaxID=222816 RepID=UPI000625D416|nr:UPF0598 protein CG30010 [Orussus abietinus]